MEKYNVLLGYLQKQRQIMLKLYDGLKDIDLSVYENQYVFALKAQQLYTTYEDFLKSVAGACSLEDFWEPQGFGKFQPFSYFPIFLIHSFRSQLV